MKLKLYAREMRRNPTAEEQTIWRWLRDRRFQTWKFRRQHPIGNYIVDFYCAELKLAIELDGAQHVNSAYDAARDCELSKAGVTVLRITNERIRTDWVGVGDTILAAIERCCLESRAPHPRLRRTFSPRRGEKAD